MNTLKVKEKLFPYVLLAPYFALFAAFLAYPIVRGVYISFFDWGIFGPSGFVGLGNYVTLFHDSRFWNAMVNTLFFAALDVPLMVCVPLLLAVLVKERIPGISVFRTSFFIPIVINAAVAAVAVGWILDPNVGVLNKLLTLLDLPPQAWLSQVGWAMFAVVLVAVWTGAGFNTIIFLAGLEGIPQALMEAARCDGATSWRCFWYITLPMLRPVTLLVTILSLVNALQVFGEIYILTGGGPFRSTEVLTYLLYQRGFDVFKFGEAAAIGVVLTIIIATLSVIQFRLFRER